jgi:hypothetical protein
MKTAFFSNRFSFVLGVMLLAGAVQPVCAQTLNWVIQTFTDSDICDWSSSPPVTLAFDSIQDDTGDGGGSCHVSFDFAGNGVFDIYASFECCNCDLVETVVLTNYASVDFDVKWDNTVTPDQFNSSTNLGSSGLVIEANSNIYSGSICYSNVYIPNSATSGWAHVSVPINPASPSAANPSVGISLVELFAASGSGKAAFWLDNVELVSRGSLQLLPAISHRSGNNFTLGWIAIIGSTCTVLKSTDLVNWSPLVTVYPASAFITSYGAFYGYTDTAATNSQSFYHISVP